MTEEIESVGANLPEKDWFKFDGDKFVTCDRYGNIIKKPPVKDLRDEMAMAALPALIARHRADVPWSRIAPLTYEIADSMLAAREEK